MSAVEFVASSSDLWRLRAACRASGVDPDWFFPEKWQSQDAAKTVCAQCVVRAQCAAVAVEEPCGIWGGLNVRERRELRSRRRMAS